MNKKVVILTGVSGSGKSVALRQLEDQGFDCIDNLPVPFVADVVHALSNDGVALLALVVDVRSRGDLISLPKTIHELKQEGIAVQVFFLDADNATVMQRYHETRRQHPLTNKLSTETEPASLEHCILHERQLLSPLRDIAYVMDTSGVSPVVLRRWVSELISDRSSQVVVTIQSFAFKEGVPNDADLVFDARCLPNPYYDVSLRPLTGKDEAVQTWFEQYPQVAAFVDDIEQFIQKWSSYYLNDTRSYLTVAVGCTGGQHRSVYVAQQLAHRLGDLDGRALRLQHRALR